MYMSAVKVVKNSYDENIMHEKMIYIIYQIAPNFVNEVNKV
jgi:hypothetical protein